MEITGGQYADHVPEQFNGHHRAGTGSDVTVPAAELWHRAKLRPMLLWRYRAWRKDHRAALFQRRRHPGTPGSDSEHLAAAAAWLCRAQDLSGDGGVIGRYRLDQGWTSSYPETTGYIIPTFLDLAEHLDPSYAVRAERCVEFLLGTQLDSGAFPAGEIAVNRAQPSPFNTAQIINGLQAWHVYRDAPEVLAAAVRAGRWLVAEQDDDGAWRQWFYHNTPATYAAHLTCWLAELGHCCNDRTMHDSAGRHLDWVLRQRCEETAWFDQCGFTREEQRLRIADLHTIAYTLAGVLRTAQVLEHGAAVAAVRAAALQIAGVLEREQWLPGMLDWQWRARADSACLTGNAQMALIWLALYRLDSDPVWLRSARAALDLVKRAQLMAVENPDLHGAIPGPDPLWGWYNDGAVLNWAAKFFIDALRDYARLAPPVNPAG